MAILNKSSSRRIPSKSGSSKMPRFHSSDGQYRPSMEGKIPSKPKQTGAPKRPLSAYFFYLKDVREETKENNPDLKMVQITKLIAEQWAKMSKRDKRSIPRKRLKQKINIRKKGKNMNNRA